MSAPLTAAGIESDHVPGRADDLALVEDHHGAHPFSDMVVLATVFRRLGWSALTDEALEMLADEYRREAAFVERINAENRALYARQNGGQA